MIDPSYFKIWILCHTTVPLVSKPIPIHCVVNNPMNSTREAQLCYPPEDMPKFPLWHQKDLHHKSRNPQTLGEGEDVSWRKFLYLKIFWFPVATFVIKYAGCIKLLLLRHTSGSGVEEKGAFSQLREGPCSSKDLSMSSSREQRAFSPKAPAHVHLWGKAQVASDQSPLLVSPPSFSSDLHVPTVLSPALFILALVGKW